MNRVDRYIRLRAPDDNGQTLAVPPVACFREVLAKNRKQRETNDCDIQGRSLTELAAEAREQLLHAALEFTRSYCDSSATADAEAPIVLTGHQPEIVHPGVWLKNFAAASLAAKHGGTAVNLIIDSDLCHTPAIGVPTGSSHSPRLESVPYDRPCQEIPLEQRPLVDTTVWDSFGERVYEKIAPLVPNPLARAWWSEVAGRAGQASSLGLCLARARHLQEFSWHPDCREHGLELPQSRVCQLPAFRWFAAHVLAQLPRFLSAHNESLADYRALHRLRNHAQPVPDLAEVDGWLETPFWIWSTGEPQRRALFARCNHAGLRLTDRHGFEETLPISDDAPAEAAVEALAGWEARGVKLRTRALLTTLFARLVLADLFIHGIGGAKYDHVTDAIAARFFGQAPPTYLTLSGTLRLPIDHQPLDRNRPREVAQLLRELTYHPERHINRALSDGSDHDRVHAIVQSKLAAIESPKTVENAATRHLAIVSANAALQPWLAAERKSLERELVETHQRSRANRILDSREHAFCLFPQDCLRDFLLDFSRTMP